MVIVIGAGITGLTATYEISKKEYVIVLEKNNYIGGLLSSFKIDNYWIERYYHHIFSSGYENFLKLLQELNLSSKVIWKPTKMGFYDGNKVYSFITPIDVLFFKPLSFQDKIDFARVILKLRFMKSPESIKNKTVKEWFKENGMIRLYEKFFKPWLKIKYGEYSDVTSASWLWNRINKRAKSRTKSMFGERLGYIKGGFEVVNNALKERIERNGEIKFESEVTKIITKNGRVEGVVINGDEIIKDDVVISTIPAPILLQTVDFSKQFEEQMKKIKYNGNICAIFGLKKRLTDFYWINTVSKRTPLTVLVEHTNFIPSENYGGQHILYASSYPNMNNQSWSKNEKELKNFFIEEINKIFKLDEKDVLWYKISKEKYSTPVYDADYTRYVPNYKTPIKGLYLAGMDLCFPDRDIEASVKTGIDVANLILNKS